MFEYLSKELEQLSNVQGINSRRQFNIHIKTPSITPLLHCSFTPSTLSYLLGRGPAWGTYPPPGWYELGGGGTLPFCWLP